MQADAAASSEQLATSCDRHARVVVCSGVDCMGLGGGAALLEIEELCAEVSSSSGGAKNVEAVSGVCTLQCANAPNVNVHALASDGRSLAVSNHLRVDSAARCVEVLAVATSPPGAERGARGWRRRRHHDAARGRAALERAAPAGALPQHLLSARLRWGDVDEQSLHRDAGGAGGSHGCQGAPCGRTPRGGVGGPN